VPLTSQGLILLTAGILVLGFGLYFFFYSEYTWIWGTTYPYRAVGLGGIIFGFLLLAAGINDMVKAQPSLSAPTLPSPVPVATSGQKRFCRYCGAENKIDAVYCEKCGKKIG
jgi:hypothetical protein